jgi:hypothetical protein
MVASCLRGKGLFNWTFRPWKGGSGVGSGGGSVVGEGGGSLGAEEIFFDKRSFISSSLGKLISGAFNSLF